MVLASTVMNMCSSVLLCLMPSSSICVTICVSLRLLTCDSACSCMFLYRHVTCEHSYEHVLLLLYAQYVNMSCHVSCVMCHASCVMRRVFILLYAQHVICHVSCVNMSCVICHRYVFVASPAAAAGAAAASAHAAFGCG